MLSASELGARGGAWHVVTWSSIQPSAIELHVRAASWHVGAEPEMKFGSWSEGALLSN